MGLSYQNRAKVRIRENYKDQFPILGEENISQKLLQVFPLQCSHLSHDKSLKEYDTPEMCVLVNQLTHYAYHLIMDQSPAHRKILGLTYSQNGWTLAKLWNDICDNRDQYAPEISDQELDNLVEKAKVLWFYLIGVES